MNKTHAFQRGSLVLLLLVAASSALGTTFIVPTDDEMVVKSAAIVIGTAEGSFVRETGSEIETIYEIRVDRAIKGGVRAGELVRVVTPGGIIGDRGVIVPAAARFSQGERVLLFLTRDGDEWQSTDMTLGKFRFATSTAGARLLVRDMEDVVGWDHAGRLHHEKVRREAGFLRFIEERVRGRAARQDYVVDSADVTLAPEPESPFSVSANATSYPARTYTSAVNNQPIRWPNMSAGVRFYKRSDQNIAGATDGGVSAIQSGLAAWSNECGSVIVLSYAGTIARASANHDATNVVEYNDPQARISGSWTGAGTVAITFLSFSGSHTFLSESWLNITDADVVFQNGYTASNASFPAAMTHELGHGIGWRHSNQDWITDGACNSSVEECTSAAIMNSSVSANYGYTLQPWDVNAAQSVYPGGTCGTPPTCTAPAITAQPVNATVRYGTATTLSVTATGTSPRYQWYSAAGGSAFAPISGATSRTLGVAPAISTSYYVVVSSSCGTVTSNRVVVTVSGGSTAGSYAVRVLPPASSEWQMVGAGDFNGDGYPDIVLHNTSTLEIYVWMMREAAVISTSTFIGRTASTDWQIRAMADFNRDGSTDIVIQSNSTGQVYIWTMNRTTVLSTGNFVLRAAANWRVVAAADFNADGSPDLLLQNQVDRRTAVWTMSGLTVVNPNNLLLTSGSNWMAYAASDVNRDGYSEVFLRSSATGSNAIWFTSGLRVTSTSTLLPTLSDRNWRMVTVADFNRDASIDILWQSSAIRDAAIWYLNGTTVRTP